MLQTVKDEGHMLENQPEGVWVNIINVILVHVEVGNIIVSLVCGVQQYQHWHFPMIEIGKEIKLTKSVSRCSWSARWETDAKLVSSKLITTKARAKGLA